MNNNIDIFEILNLNNENDQEQNDAPDFNFVNVREFIRELEPEPDIRDEFDSLFGEDFQSDFTIISELESAPVIMPEYEPEPVVQVTLPPEVVPVPKSEPAPEPKPVKKSKHQKKKKSFGKTLVKLIVMATVITAVLTFITGVPKISENSMEPMISSGDRVAVNKLSKSFRKGDVIVFKSITNEKMTARIVAVKGDVVNIKKDGLYINDQLQNEENIRTETAITDTAVVYPVIVDEGTYFVLGDNRTESRDSRNSDIGLINKDDIIGKVIFCFKKI